MIDTEQSIIIDAPLERVWDFASNIDAWAQLMPGLQTCDVLDADHSRWTLKVGAGALVRTVKVAVTVERWAGPEEVDFSYKLESDPVQGGGTYRAKAVNAHQTELSLAVRIEGTGPMAPMWEAMGRPLLPKFARGFTEQFKEALEQQQPTPRPSPLARLLAWLRRLIGRGAPQQTEETRP